MDRTNKIKKVVIKIGTSVLLDRDKRVSINTLKDIALQVRQVKDMGISPVIVSSGAIACGMECMGLKKRPKEIEKRQALASIGQIELMKLYMEAFQNEGMKVGQILLTHEDIKSRSRCINLMNTLNTLLAMEIVPVVNENDVLSFREIKFGDNDNLSALIAQISSADLLLLLSDVEGLYEQDPKSSPSARIITQVKRIDENIERIAGGTKSEKSTGGMISKLEAAKKAGLYGIPTMLVKGDKKDVILKAIKGDDVGTLFLPERRLTRNRWWAAFAFKCKGRVLLDEGAERAILYNGKSLLPSGIIAIEGDFSRGDCIEIGDRSGNVIAKGMTNYSSSDINIIKGLKSIDIEKKLGYKYADEVVHRNNMVVL